MKKVLYLLFAVIVFTSCACPYCGEYPCICNCDNAKHVNNYSVGSSDYFSAATLVGQWQMSGYHDSQYMSGCGFIPKAIAFAPQEVGCLGRCTMTYAVANDPQWYQMDLAYNYVNKELTFYKLNQHGKWEKNISFSYKSFLYPTLTIQDSFDTYEWNKVRTTTND